MENLKPEQYARIRKVALDAFRWMEKTSPLCEDVAQNADKAETRLLSLANCAASFATVSAHPSTIGVFGASQAGKSYLVNTLSAGGDKLTTNWGGKEIDFLQLVNPTGNNHEATGIVTRFTHVTGKPLESSSKIYPVELKIMSAVEIAMILVNSFNNDLNFTSEEKQAINESLYTDEALLSHVKRVAGDERFTLGENERSLVGPDDVVALANYIHDKADLFDLARQKADGAFWSQVRRVAPKLNAEGVCELFSVLWGNLASCSIVFKKIAAELSRLKGAREVFTGIDSFVADDEVNGQMCQKKFTVNNIETVSNLFEGAGNPIDVAMLNDEGQVEVVEKVDFACLAAATIELIFPLNQKGSAGDFDILDFPGARERKKIAYVNFKDDETGNRSELEEGGTTKYIRKNGPEMLRRGKVAYIFDRYTRDREADILLLCLNTFNQAEVTSLTPIVEGWIASNIGEDSTARARALKSPFICILTRCDQTIEFDINRELGTVSGSFKFISNCFENFSSSTWLNDWDGRPFSQIFFVRSPGYSDKVFQMDGNNKEISLGDWVTKNSKLRIADAVKEFRDGVCQDKMASQVSVTAQKAFDEMMKPNDGGITLIKSFIKDNFTGYTESRNRMDEKILHMADEAAAFVTKYAGAESGAKRSDALLKARQLSEGLLQCDDIACVQGMIRSMLELDDDVMRERYLKDYVEYKNAPRFALICMEMLDEKVAGLSSGAGFDALFETVNSAWESGMSNYTRFDNSKRGYSFFYDKVKGRWLKPGAELRDRFSALMRNLSQSLLDSAVSMDLRHRLTDALEINEKEGNKQGDMAAKQVRTAQQMISGFFCFLGYDTSLRPKNLALSRRSEVTGDKTDDDRPLFGEKIENAIEKDGDESSVSTLPLVSDELMAGSGRHYLEDFLWALSNLMCSKNLAIDSPYKFSDDVQHEIDTIAGEFDEISAHKSSGGQSAED